MFSNFANNLIEAINFTKSSSSCAASRATAKKLGSCGQVFFKDSFKLPASQARGESPWHLELKQLLAEVLCYQASEFAGKKWKVK